MRDISLDDDILDSRDIDKRIEELEGIDERGEEEDDELRVWLEFREQASGSEWKYGQTFIADSYMEDYARELAEDIGSVSRDQAWPYCHIDWEAATDALKMDYSEIEVEGRSFWTRD